MLPLGPHSPDVTYLLRRGAYDKKYGDILFARDDTSDQLQINHSDRLMRSPPAIGAEASPSLPWERCVPSSGPVHMLIRV